MFLWTDQKSSSSAPPVLLLLLTSLLWFWFGWTQMTRVVSLLTSSCRALRSSFNSERRRNGSEAQQEVLLAVVPVPEGGEPPVVHSLTSPERWSSSLNVPRTRIGTYSGQGNQRSDSTGSLGTDAETSWYRSRWFCSADTNLTRTRFCF